MTDRATKKKEQEYTEGIGRRKTSSARVRIYQGKGEMVVNDLPIEEYFPGEVARVHYHQPFVVTTTLDKFDLSAKVSGGGRSAQLAAVVLGAARALAKSDEKHKAALKEHRLLSRDPRMVERKKPGRVKARKRRQSPKR